MISDAVAHSLRDRGIHYAWVIAGVTFVAMLSTSAALGLPGAMLRPLSREFGWTTEQLSGVFAVRFGLFGLMGPFAALFIGRYGLRRILIISASMIATSMLLVTFATRLWQIVILWGLLLGSGTGLTAMVLGAVVANRWFAQRRGLVIGFLMASTATGQLIFLPMAAWLIEYRGWRIAVLPVLGACSVVALLSALLMRELPRDVGLRAYGEPDRSVEPLVLQSVPMNFWSPLSALSDAARDRTFWMLAGTFFVCGVSTNGLIQTHFISLCGDNGLTPIPAAAVLSMMGIFDLIGTTLSGYLSDHWDNRKLLFWYYALRGLSLFWLPYSTFTFYGLTLFAMFYGLDWIATVPPTVKLCTQRFGREHAGLVFGWIFAFHQLGAAVAAYGAGLTRTLLLTYTPALLAAGSACLLAAVGVMLIRRPLVPMQATYDP